MFTSLCHSKFTIKPGLKRHVEYIHEGKKPAFVCTFCSKRFELKKDMKNHINVVHEGKKPFDCKICFKKIYKKSNIDRTYQISS